MPTSGRSGNVYMAERAARSQSMTALGLYGQREGCLCKPDVAVYVPSKDTARIQEAHTVVCHAIVELVEDMWEQGNQR